MTLENLDTALRAFRKGLLKNGTWEDGAIDLRYNYPDWDWVTFRAIVHIKGTNRDATISASWNTLKSPIRLCDWEGEYKDAPFKKYNVL